jgi:hypothetical protein
MRRSGGVAAFLVGAALLVAASSAGAVVVPIYDGAPYHGKGLQKKPYVLTWTGDGTGVLGGLGHPSRRYPGSHLHWTAWSNTVGRAWGANWLDDCNPDCADGLHTPFRVNVTVYRPRSEYGYRIFTRMTITYTRSIPRGVRGRTQRLTVAHDAGGFNWDF